MDNYFQKTNKDISNLRKILIALVSDLNKKLLLKNYINGEIVETRIPFYFSMAGGETYLQDNFVSDLSQDLENDKMEGEYSQVPRGMVQVNGMNIDTENLANRWTPLPMQIEEDGQIKRIRALNRNIPITLNVDCKIILDNILNTFIVSETLIKEIYKKSGTFYDYNGIPIPVTYRFPFDINSEQTTEFTWNEKKQYEISFSLTINSFLLDLVEESKRFEGNRMESITVRISDKITDNK